MMKNLNVSLNIYSLSAIEQAKNEYENLAKIDVFPNGDHCTLVFQKCKYNENQTIKEFENYLIGLENS